MTPVLVDTNVLIDIASGDRVWAQWSAAMLTQVLDESIAVINPIVYGELAAGIDTLEELDRVVPVDLYRREELPYAAAFLAGAAYRTYRDRGGRQRHPLADFYIGAHAAVAGYRLLTRDPRRYRAYFPRLALIAPDTAA